MKYFKIIVFCLVLSLWWTNTESAQPQTERLVQVASVVDGDTIILLSGEHVRYIGIDTPEVRKKINKQWIYNPQPFSEEASEFNRSLVEGKQVRLELDIERADKYKRLLAYVFINGKMINEELLRQGFARIYRRTPNIKYKARLIKAENEARQAKRGIWSLE